ncbi:hypothetical protein Tco_1430894 [Tanacetum coccineum]
MANFLGLMGGRGGGVSGGGVARISAGQGSLTFEDGRWCWIKDGATLRALGVVVPNSKSGATSAKESLAPEFSGGLIQDVVGGEGRRLITWEKMWGRRWERSGGKKSGWVVGGGKEGGVERERKRNRDEGGKEGERKKGGWKVEQESGWGKGKRQDKWKCVLTRLIDDLLALDSKVRFDISDRRLELTATFSIPTYSETSVLTSGLSLGALVAGDTVRFCSGVVVVKCLIVVSVVSVNARTGTSADSVSESLKDLDFPLSFFCLSKTWLKESGDRVRIELCGLSVMLILGAYEDIEVLRLKCIVTVKENKEQVEDVKSNYERRAQLIQDLPASLCAEESD